MKKKLILNICMVLTIVLVALCGVMAVGSVKGWFGNEAESDMIVSDKTGIAMIERNGVAYELAAGTAIRPDDKIYTKTNATLTISKSGNDYIYLGSNAEITMTETKETSTAEILKGEALIDARNLENITILSAETQILMNQAVATVSTQAGAGMVYVYAGDVSISRTSVEESTTIVSGEVVTMVENSEEYSTSLLQANSLSDVQIQLLGKCGMDDSFCFSKADLEEVQAEREAEILKAQQEALKQKEEAKKKAESESSAEINMVADTSSTQVSNGVETEGAHEQIPIEYDSEYESDEDYSSESEDDASYDEMVLPDDTSMSCTIEIRCDTILNNMDYLASGKESYVPSSGTILGTTSVEFTEGETVFDVLQSVCDSAGIQLEYSYTPLYESYYIEGINHLYEFDCGSESGWMYKVNGWFPNYGCSSYYLEDGDTIVWCYTCNGLGADVGGSVY